jgi:hypothetical protein
VITPRVKWPALPGLGVRTVGAFAECRDCGDDAAAGKVVRVGGVTMTTPGQHGTFVKYGATPLCRRHAIQCAGLALVAEVIAAFDGEVVEVCSR